MGSVAFTVVTFRNSADASIALAPHLAVLVGGFMYQLLARFKSILRRDEGQDLLEYALLIALIAIVCVAAITLAGTNVRDTFNNIAGSI